MNSLRSLIEKRAERSCMIKELESKSESELIVPERINFYFATLRILHQIRRTDPNSVIGMNIRDVIKTICDLEQKTSYFGMLATSPKSVGGGDESRVNEVMEDIANNIKLLGYQNIFKKEIEFSNKENMDLHRAQRIIPGLFLGGSTVANDKKKLEALGITHIVCCLQGSCRFPNDFKYLNIPMYDAPFENIYKYFTCSYDFIHEALNNSLPEKPNSVYIHCAAGISRAPTICAAYLMRELKISSIQAINLIKLSRPYIAPNPGFLTQLYNYQNILKSTIIKNRNQQEINFSNIEQGVPFHLNWKRNNKKKEAML
ncbi:dual specificity protein phosphatase [Cryptosporidium ryanae]|uniref:dual specificity protein phosphatase n=1 Tax=Cryptosporidium ryanae TaxID=515981 RepID=UPI003519FA3E|nr:dual specificity protein phosphatase [Cryptosporidium ryanae]